MLDEQKYSMKMLLSKQELKNGYPVYLKVYHITKVNYILQLFGFGLFHSSLEVDCHEYSFGSTEDGKSGIYMNPVNEEHNGVSLKGKGKLG